MIEGKRGGRLGGGKSLARGACEQERKTGKEEGERGGPGKGGKQKR